MENQGIRASQIMAKIIISVVVTFLILALSSIAAMILFGSPSSPGFSVSKIETATQISMFLFTIILMVILGRGKLTQFGFRMTTAIPFCRILFLSLVIAFPASLMADMLNSGGHMPTESFSFPLIVLIVFIGASISEELLFRGLIQGYLAPLTGAVFTIWGIRISVPVLVPAILFGLMHMALISAGATLGAVLTIVISGMILGIIAGYYREKTGSLLPAILTHMCFNIWGSVADYVINLR